MISQYIDQSLFKRISKMPMFGKLYFIYARNCAAPYFLL